MDIDSLKNLLRRNNLKPNFTYGQNFLIDDLVLEDIVDAAAVSPEDAVLEIGPGIGNLTRRLCERAGSVLSVEKDSKFFPLLRSIKKDYPKNFRFEIADALEYNFQDFFKNLNSPRRQSPPLSLPPQGGEIEGYKVVANIPYFITGKILQMLMTAEFKPSSIVVLTQKEVAERVVARPGDLSLLAISVQLFGEPQIVRSVPARAFFPAPKVDSAILKIDLYEKPRYEIPDEKKFFRMLKACFAGKRKQLHNTLVNNLKLDKTNVSTILSSLGIDSTTRPQELSIEEWIALNSKLQIPNNK